MNTLFPIEPDFPPGFSYTENFITENEELKLLEVIRSLSLQTFIFRGYEAKRKVASYGYDYHFDNRSISKGKPIPPGFNFLLEKIASTLNIDEHEFTELLVTEYPEGSVINWHRDAPPFKLIAGISLLADCKFKLRPYDKVIQTRESILSFPVKRRSLYVMQNEAREDWEHSIDKMKQVRYSVTLRTLKIKD
ncbi:MAG: alpha-ketoglutarate-dependent dioxygenase AlkB [Bacteroidetes bacterium]|nr:alpha-ketoglutarate-dependent dioxygenase AlkB [Bacteroidota bacterium]